MQESKIGVLLY